MGVRGACRPREHRPRLGMDPDHLSPVPRLCARSVQGVLRALVRHAQGAARVELRNAARIRARTLPQFLYARAGRYLRRLPHLRAVTVLSSKDNPKVRHWRKLAEDARYRRAQRRALIEGPHLLQAVLEHGRRPLHVLATEKGAADMEIRKILQRGAIRPVLLTEAALRSIADAETPQGVAAEIEV